VQRENGLGIDIATKPRRHFPIREDPPFDLQWGRLRSRWFDSPAVVDFTAWIAIYEQNRESYVDGWAGKSLLHIGAMTEKPNRLVSSAPDHARSKTGRAAERRVILVG